MRRDSSTSSKLLLNNGLALRIDVGSMTVKTIAVDPECSAILYSRYERHETRQAEKVLEQLRDVAARFPEVPLEILKAMWRCRRILGAVPVNRLKPKPKVSIIGEFWAMTTEGDGNYQLQRFLESEGAVDTTGDGAVNVQSRIQMDMFKARQSAEAEYRETLEAAGLEPEDGGEKSSEVQEVENASLPEGEREDGGTGATQLLELGGRS